jgi:hypothetical protein
MPFHVRIEQGLFRRDEAFNVDAIELNTKFVEPWRRGNGVLLGGRRWDPHKARLRVREGPRLTTDQRSMGQGWLNACKFGEDVTEAALRGEFDAGVLPTAGIRETSRARDSRSVAVAYGRDRAARDAMFDFLRTLNLLPLEWEQLISATGSASPYTGEAVEAAFRICQAVAVLFTPDDEARLHPELRGDREEALEAEFTGQPRQNVLVEAGMAFALRRRQTVIVEIGHLRPISNFAGLNAVRLDGTPEPLNALAQRLEDAGCPVRRSAGDWLNPERFAGLSAIARVPSEAPASRPRREPAAVIARRLDGELRESQDLIGEAIRDHRFWLPPRRLPDFVWQQYDEELAALDPDVHEAVQDAYRKLNQLNWTVPERAQQEQPGAILQPGEGLILDPNDEQDLSGRLQVIRHAQDVLRQLVPGP